LGVRRPLLPVDQNLQKEEYNQLVIKTKQNKTKRTYGPNDAIVVWAPLTAVGAS
jgi:hypothetical protein